MAGYELLTKSGRNFYDMSSLLQKAIRRGDYKAAGFAAYELEGKFSKYLWKRLLIISAEDCYGIMTKEIVALQQAAQFCEKNKGSGEGGGIFIAKAIMLLCLALKNRDACYFACNFMNADNPVPADDLDYFPLEECRLPDDKVPDYTYDCHTLQGKRRGKNIRDMVLSEQAGLNPLQMSFFDNENWEPFLTKEGHKPLTEAEIRKANERDC